jgi:hypothetical protein
LADSDPDLRYFVAGVADVSDIHDASIFRVDFEVTGSMYVRNVDNRWKNKANISNN